MQKLNELLFFYKKKGLRETAKRIFTRYGRVLKFRINAVDLTKDFKGIPLGPEYTVIKDDLNALDKIRNSREDLPREFYIDKTHKGKRFYLFLYNSEPVFIHWVFGKGEFSKFCDIQDEKTVELQYAYTLPPHRGKRVMAKALDYTCKDLKRKGYEKVVNVVSEGNVNVIRGLEFTGLTPITSVRSYFSLVRKVKV